MTTRCIAKETRRESQRATESFGSVADQENNGSQNSNLLLHSKNNMIRSSMNLHQFVVLIAEILCVGPVVGLTKLQVQVSVFLYDARLHFGTGTKVLRRSPPPPPSSWLGRWMVIAGNPSCSFRGCPSLTVWIHSDK